jgi:putative flippase GtrA
VEPLRSTSRFVVLIPAYKPGPDFPSLVFNLIANGVERIVIVDDGSGWEYRSRFDLVALRPQVRLCRHAVNLGKGAALKTGINTILCEYADTSIVVTADADAQHHPSDILRVAQFAEAHPQSLVLGVRSFSGNIPLRSRFGNEATKIAMRVIVGQKLTDAQTGLRAIPYHLLPQLLKLAPQGYDFELDMLLETKEKRIPILEVPIQTIYLDGSASSHFDPILDSMRIYFVLFRFALASMCTALIDNLLFSLIFLRSGSITKSQIAARTVAMIFNFLIVKRVVFKSNRRPWRELVEYVALVAGSGAVSYGLIRILMTYLGLSVLRSKLLAEAILFSVNFLVQRDLIFAGGEEAAQRVEAERLLRASAALTDRIASQPRD